MQFLFLVTDKPNSLWSFFTMLIPSSFFFLVTTSRFYLLVPFFISRTFLKTDGLEKWVAH